MAAHAETTASSGEGEVPLDLSIEAGWQGAAVRPHLAATCFRELHDADGKHLLDLSRVGVRQFPTGFWGQVRGVVKLQLYGNFLTELPAELGRLGASLRVLVLTHNLELKTLSGAALAQLTVLEEMNLCKTGVASLPDELFAMASLRILYLTDCKALFEVGHSEGAFPRLGQMTNLTTLNLDCCGLRGELDAAVGNLVNLEDLNLAQNPELTGIPEEALGQLVKLTSLKHAYCTSLATLPASIGRLTRLEELNCYGTGLETLPPQIGDCVALKTLRLSHCESLTHLPPSLSRCTALEHLFLSSTPALQSPPPEVGARFEFHVDPAPAMEFLRKLDAGRLTKGATAGAAGK